MLKIGCMWKYGSEGIYFNNIFIIFVRKLYHPKLGAVPRIQNILYRSSI